MESDTPSSREPRVDGAKPEASFTDIVLGWLRSLRRPRNGEGSLRESLEELIEEHEEAEEPTETEEWLMLRNILALNQTRVDDVMVPRADIVAAEEVTPLDELVKIFHQAGHSRLPVFRETLDDVTGMIHIKDLLTRWGSEEPLDMQGLVREVLFVPPSMPVLDLLQQMQASHIHMAVVVDEYGGTDGLATIEDLVEEIVGEIEDEHDQAEAPQIVEAADGTLEVDARTPIEELENRIALDLLPEQQDEDIDTVGGLVFSVLGRVPRRGELIGHPAGFEFEVIDADPRRIKRLKIRGLPVTPEVVD
jgi:CBS domain containing-hemolysin-like protein